MMEKTEILLVIFLLLLSFYLVIYWGASKKRSENKVDIEGPLGKKSLFVDLDMFDLKINEGKDIFDRNFSFKKIDIDKRFPEYIRINHKKFENWIIK